MMRLSQTTRFENILKIFIFEFPPLPFTIVVIQEELKGTIESETRENINKYASRGNRSVNLLAI